MAVVKVKTFIVSTSPHPLAQADLDTVAASANVFLATLSPVNVLDVEGRYAPGGKDGVRSSYIILVSYLA